MEMSSAEKTIIRIDIRYPVRYRWGGLFVAPDAYWMHMNRRLADFELMVVQRGVLYIADEDGEYEVHEGEYILMAPDSQQYGHQASDCAFYWMHFTAHNPEEYHQMELPPEGIPYESDCVVLAKQAALTSRQRVYTLMQGLADTERRYSDPQENGFMATSVLCEVQNQMRNALHLHNEKENLLFEGINDYIASHIGERLQVKDIAERFGYNEKYLTTLFREKTGISLKQHIISLKLSRAQFLLCNTNASIAEISYNLSYWDEQSFSTAFKKYCGMTPTEFRRMYSAGLVNRV